MPSQPQQDHSGEGPNTNGHVPPHLKHVKTPPVGNAKVAVEEAEEWVTPSGGIHHYLTGSGESPRKKFTFFSTPDGDEFHREKAVLPSEICASPPSQVEEEHSIPPRIGAMPPTSQRKSQDSVLASYEFDSTESLIKALKCILNDKRYMIEIIATVVSDRDALPDHILRVINGNPSNQNAAIPAPTPTLEPTVESVEKEAISSDSERDNQTVRIANTVKDKIVPRVVQVPRIAPAVPQAQVKDTKEADFPRHFDDMFPPIAEYLAMVEAKGVFNEPRFKTEAKKVRKVKAPVKTPTKALLKVPPLSPLKVELEIPEDGDVDEILEAEWLKRLNISRRSADTIPAEKALPTEEELLAEEEFPSADELSVGNNLDIFGEAKPVPITVVDGDLEEAKPVARIVVNGDLEEASTEVEQTPEVASKQGPEVAGEVVGEYPKVNAGTPSGGSQGNVNVGIPSGGIQGPAEAGKDPNVDIPSGGATKNCIPKKAGQFMTDWPEQQPRRQARAGSDRGANNRQKNNGGYRAGNRGGSRGGNRGGYHNGGNRGGRREFKPAMETAVNPKPELLVCTLECAVLIEAIPPGATKQLVIREIRGGAVHSLVMMSTRNGEKYAIIMFKESVSADRFFAYHQRSPISVLDIKVRMRREVPRDLLPPFLEPYYSNETRCLHLSNLPEHKYRSTEISRWVFGVLEGFGRPDVEFDHSAGTASLRFTSIRHARAAMREIIDVKTRSAEWRYVRVEYEKDPCGFAL